MLKKTVAGATLMAAGLAISAGPALASAAPGAIAIHAQAITDNAVQPVHYRRGGYAVRRPYAGGGWGYRRSVEWGAPYSYGAYNPGYYSGSPGYYGGYSGWGSPAGYWGGYSGWGPGVSIGVAPGFGIGFGF
ncbi:MAG TPA: hypothetical protein VNR65_12375 [Geobacterales bacterium]|nr:hypothetical protein [Geobacterales bacterium]